MKDSVKEKHPSYGMIDISRVTTTPKMPLFGSSILHGELIALRIKHAEADRHLNRDWYFGHDEIIEVYMSYSQFTQAIMSMNTSGTPVTIKHINRERIQQKENLQDTKEMFSKEFQHSINKTFEKARSFTERIVEIIDSGTPINKAQKKELRSLAQSIEFDIQGNMAFVMKSFEEQMNKTTTESVGEREAFFDAKIQSLGILALQNQILQLPEQGE